jgi:hypothetical protein
MAYNTITDINIGGCRYNEVMPVTVAIMLDNDGYIMAQIEDIVLCCEDYGINMPDLNIGDKIHEIRYFEKPHRYTEGDSIGLILVVGDDREEVEIELYNIHNGYYDHKVEVHVKSDVYNINIFDSI